MLYDTSEALDLLEDDLFVESIKLFNLRNMRKGGLIFAYAHCMDLADQLLKDIYE